MYAPSNSHIPVLPYFSAIVRFLSNHFRSCGTLTRSAEQTTPAGYLNSALVTSCDKSSYTDTPNWCNTTPYKPSEGRMGGEIYFILVDCDTHVVLKDGQPAAYNYPGVSTAPNRV